MAVSAQSAYGVPRQTPSAASLIATRSRGSAATAARSCLSKRHTSTSSSCAVRTYPPATLTRNRCAAVPPRLDHRPEPGDRHLQRHPRLRGWIAGPQLVDESLGGDGSTVRGDQHRQNVAFPALRQAADLAVHGDRQRSEDLARTAEPGRSDAGSEPSTR